MAKKENKVSINSVDKFLKSRNLDPVVVTLGKDENALQFTVKRMLNWTEMTAMVYNAANGVFFEEDGETVYHPEFEEIAKASAMMTFVANFKSDMSMSKVHELMYSGVLDAIQLHWMNQQRYDFEDQVRSIITARVKMMIAGERDKLMKISTKLDQASDTMKMIADAFGDISPEQMQDVVNAMSNMDELSLAQAVVDARDKDFVEQRRGQLEVIK